jgi:hypothetical protein
MKSAITLAALMLTITAHVRSQEAISSQGKVCWPLSFAGVVVGTTTDSQVQRLLGPGVVRKNEGDTRGRYFINQQQTATLHVVECTDTVVCELSVSAGVPNTIKPSERASAVTKWLDTTEGFGNWHALHLGSPRDAALENLGKPKQQVSADEWVYETGCSCEIQNYFTLYFKSGH